MPLIVDLHAIGGLIRVDAHLATALKALDKQSPRSARASIESVLLEVLSLKAWLDKGTEVPQEEREHVRQYRTAKRRPEPIAHAPRNSRER